jgi:Flp pilus assembly protein TadD
VQFRENLARSLVAVGRADDAVEQLRPLLAALEAEQQAEPDPVREREIAQVTALLAKALEQAGNAEDALNRFREAVRRRPTDAGLRVKLGLCLFRQSRLDDALEQFELAASLEPDNATAHRLAGNACFKLGRPREALRHWRASLAADPNDDKLRRNVAVLERELEAAASRSSGSGS